MRRAVASTTAAATACASNVRQMHLPGWKTQLSTGDARSKEQREVDRKARHIEKLPKPIAAHSPQYPYDKSIIADHMMQPIVYEDELDTPSLFNIEAPSDFFVYWNANDCNRTNYPSTPAVDHRTLAPTDAAYENYRIRSQKYLAKHGIIPTFVSQARQSVNMSVVFSGTADVRARADDEGNVIPPPPPETSLTARNFWFTAHCGNYIDLHEVQQAPSIFLTPPAEHVEKETYYTLVMASPDYPYRTAPEASFMVNYIVANIPAAGDATAPRTGTVVVPYAPPLPTEDAGTTRQLCFLYQQKGKVDAEAFHAMTAEEEKEHFPFAERSAFKLHDDSPSGKALRKKLGSLAALEKKLLPTPATVNFFQTKWDIQVQEYYERIDEAEPAYTADERYESVLTYLARSRESFQVRSRFLADGTLNQGNDSQLYVQNAETVMDQSTAFDHRSKRHLLGHNGKERVLPMKNVKLF